MERKGEGGNICFTKAINNYARFTKARNNNKKKMK